MKDGCGFTGSKLLLGRVPQFGHRGGVEVAEGAGDDVGVHVAEHPTTTEDIEPHSAEPEFLSLGQRCRIEIEGSR